MDGIPLTLSCRMLKLAPHCRWLRNPVGPSESLRKERIAALREAHEDDAEFSYRLLADEARRVDFLLANWTAWRLRRDTGIMSAIVKTGKKLGKRPGSSVSIGLAKRNFTAEGQHQLCLVDITAPHAWGRKMPLRGPRPLLQADCWVFHFRQDGSQHRRTSPHQCRRKARERYWTYRPLGQG